MDSPMQPKKHLEFSRSASVVAIFSTFGRWCGEKNTVARSGVSPNAERDWEQTSPIAASVAAMVDRLAANGMDDLAMLIIARARKRETSPAGERTAGRTAT